MDLSSTPAPANGLEFAFYEAGPNSGPLALLIHGFPDTPWTWRHLMPALAEAGYHAVAPFQRGYAPTGLPADERFQVGQLGLDANALHEALGGSDDAVIIGHDWGASATYAAIGLAPERWRCAVTASVPPLACMATAMLGYEQLRRSWYFFFFQLELAEVVVPLDDHRFLDELWATWSPGYDASEDLARVKAALGTPERLRAALSYYRALFDPAYQHEDLAEAQAAAASTSTVPTLYLHGRNDGCVGLEVVDDALTFLAPDSAVQIIDGAGHFLQLEQPKAVGEAVLNWISPR